MASERGLMVGSVEPGDARLAEAFRDGDDAAFAALYARYVRPIHDHVRGLVGEAATAEDVTQAVFLQAFEQRRTLRDPAAVRGWLYRIAHNLAMNQLTRTRPMTELDIDAPIPSMEPDPEQQLLRDQSVSLVWDAAASLEPRQFAVLDLSLRKGLSSAEIADALGLDTAQVSVLLTRAREALGNAVRFLVVARRRRHCDRLAALVPAGVRRLTAEQRASVDHHVRRCPACQRMAAVLTGPGQLFAAAPLLAVPATIEIWRAQPASAMTAASPVPHHLAGRIARAVRRPVAAATTAAVAVAVVVTAAVVVTHRPPHATALVPPAPNGSRPAAVASAGNFANLLNHPFTQVAGLPPGEYGAVACPAPGTCYVAGGNGAGQSLFNSSSDAGKTWATRPLTGLALVTAMACPTVTVCVAAGPVSGGGSALSRSADGGASWQRASTPTLGPISRIGCPDATNCLGVGGDYRSGIGQAIASSDGGRSWRSARAPGFLAAVDCLDAAHCWGAGTSVWFTADLGQTWRDLLTGRDPLCASRPTGSVGCLAFTYLGVDFTSVATGTVVGGNQCGGVGRTQCPSRVYRTTDAGASWVSWPSAYTDRFPYLVQLSCDGDACLAAGQTTTDSVLLSTQDGRTWYERQKLPAAQVLALACDPAHAFCVITAAAGDISHIYQAAAG